MVQEYHSDKNIGVFPKWGRTFIKFSEVSDFSGSDKSLKIGLNLKIPSLTCLAGAVVASWSLAQEVAGSSLFAVMTNISVTEFAEVIENI